MGFDFKSDLPIFMQIVEYIKSMIISGKYKEGERLPTVRELALFFEVNPNTVQKAFIELENTNVILTDSTNGRFVTDDKGIIEKLKNQVVNNKIEKFLEDMISLGLDKNQIIEFIKNGR